MIDGELTCSEKLLLAVRDLIVPFVKAADDAAAHRQTGRLPVDAAGNSHNVLVENVKPEQLATQLNFLLPAEGQGRQGLLEGIANVLKYSVNTWDQGFMDKLYASNSPVRLSRRHDSHLLTYKTSIDSSSGRRHLRYCAVGSQYQRTLVT